jgi:hypothetical protein
MSITPTDAGDGSSSRRRRDDLTFAERPSVLLRRIVFFEHDRGGFSVQIISAAILPVRDESQGRFGP